MTNTLRFPARLSGRFGALTMRHPVIRVDSVHVLPSVHSVKTVRFHFDGSADDVAAANLDLAAFRARFA
jgi:hypothetical protein